MRKLGLGFVVVLVICAGLYFRFHHGHGPIETVYVGSKQVTVWSSSALVKEPVATANFGDRLQVLVRSGDQVQVRTASKVVGWVDDNGLLSDGLWLQAKSLTEQTGRQPAEAKGLTRAIGNLHLGPARDAPRLVQLAKGVPVELFERRVAPVPQAAPAASASPAPTSGQEVPPAAALVRQEDWWLVRAKPAGQEAMSGWLLGRFVELNVPQPLPDYASATGVRIVAWFELNRVRDEKLGLTPQYLVLGTHGPEGQPCDFTVLRAYTWDTRKQRYETAFVESDVCGKLPLDLKAAGTPGGDAGFGFQNWIGDTAEHRNYRMTSTSIRRVREVGSSPAARNRKH
jgi:hypothetical protein